MAWEDLPRFLKIDRETQASRPLAVSIELKTQFRGNKRDIQWGGEQNCFYRSCGSCPSTSGLNRSGFSDTLREEDPDQWGNRGSQCTVF